MIKGFNICTEMKEQRKNAKTGLGETPNQIQVCFAESQPAWRIRAIMNARLCGARVPSELDPGQALSEVRSTVSR